MEFSFIFLCAFIKLNIVLKSEELQYFFEDELKFFEISNLFFLQQVLISVKASITKK